MDVLPNNERPNDEPPNNTRSNDMPRNKRSKEAEQLREVPNSVIVVLVDDDADDRYLVKRHFKKTDVLDVVCLEANDLDEAQTFVGSHDVDCLLLDLNLVASKGLNTLRQCIQGLQACPVPIVVLTGVSDLRFGLDAIRQGAEDFLSKQGVSPSTLVRSVLHSIERYSLRLRLQKLVDVDSLTGVFRLPLFLNRLDGLIGQFKRAEASLAVAMVDLDDFKGINDTYGHRVGDDVLRIIGDRLRRDLRESDMVARYGGDEFVMFFTNVADTDVLKTLMTERLRQYSQPMSLLVNQQVTEESIGVSIGAVVWDGESSATQMVQWADHALYCSKRSGKHQVTVATVEELRHEAAAAS